MYSVYIAGVDRSGDVVNQSIYIEDAINDKQNTCSFGLFDLSGLGIPATDAEVSIILPDNTKIFAGVIVSVSLEKKQQGAVLATINCADYGRLLDSYLVHKTYENMTDKEIIEAIVNTYCPALGITTTNVAMSATFEHISFNYVQVSQALRRIADLTAQNWYIDYDKDIHFFPLATNPAPFDIDDTNMQYTGLKISKDASQLKNRVYVRGGSKLSDYVTTSQKGDGVKRKFLIPEKPHSITLTVNGVAKTLGLVNIDTSGYDYYLNFQEKYIQQDDSGTLLTTSDTVAITYKYEIPILVAIENATSIAEVGVKEFAVFDKSIKTTQEARDRATAEIVDYGSNVIEGSFSTYTTGFSSGQYINISLTDYDVAADYIIQRVQARSLGGGTFNYTVSIASTKTMGIIRFLVELLEANKNLIELDDNEAVDELFNITDSLIGDSLVESLTIDSAGAYYTWSSASETSPVTRLRWGVGEWM